MMRVVVLVLAGLAMAAGPAAAYFERVETDARGLALGEAMGAGVEDVAAAHWNPGALGALPRSQAIFSYSRPFMVEGLVSTAVTAGLPLGPGGMALSWHRLGLDGTVSENLIGASYGRWIYKDNRRTLHLGATLKLASVAFDAAASRAHDFGSESRATGDLGLLWQEGPAWRFGAVLRHLGRPSFNFVGKGGGDEMPGGLELSTAYRWRPESTIYAGRTDLGHGAIYNYAGEIWFYDVFAVRAGIYNEEFAGGVGVRSRSWEVDLSFLTDKQLGNTYRASLRLQMPEKGAGR